MGAQILLPQRSQASCPLLSVSLSFTSFFLSLSLSMYLPLSLSSFGSDLTKQNLTGYL